MTKRSQHPINLKSSEILVLKKTIRDILADGSTISFTTGLHLQRILDKLNHIGANS